MTIEPVAFAAGATRDWIVTDPRRRRGMCTTGGVALVGLGSAAVFAGQLAVMASG